LERALLAEGRPVGVGELLASLERSIREAEAAGRRAALALAVAQARERAAQRAIAWQAGQAVLDA
jgi:hypothetical protein